MVLNDLLKIPDLCKGLDIYLQVSSSHTEDVAEHVKQDFMTKYRLDNANFRELLERYRQRYLETDRIVKNETPYSQSGDTY